MAIILDNIGYVRTNKNHNKKKDKKKDKKERQNKKSFLLNNYQKTFFITDVYL